LDVLYAVAAGYLLGSPPFAVGFGWIQKKNLLAQGSGNPGAINALRVLGVVPGLMVLLLDVFKGFLAVFYGALLGGTAGALAGGVAAVAGHLCSIWIRCRGGKGVATAAGVWLAVQPAAVFVLALAWAGGWLLSRDAYKSFAVAALFLAPVAYWLTRDAGVTLAGLGTSVLLFLAHLKYLRA